MLPVVFNLLSRQTVFIKCFATGPGSRWKPVQVRKNLISKWREQKSIPVPFKYFKARTFKLKLKPVVTKK
jgi:hypothetical protein